MPLTQWPLYDTPRRFADRGERAWLGAGRKRSHCRGGVPGPPEGGFQELAYTLLIVFTLVCQFHPISLVLPKETGWSPKEKRFLGWWRPREVSGPTRLSHSRGSCRSAAKVSASRTYFITRRRGEGLEPRPYKIRPRLRTRCVTQKPCRGRRPRRPERRSASW